MTDKEYLKSLRIPTKENPLRVLSSGACGSQVIYNGSRFPKNPAYQIGMGVCAAQLDRNGIKIVSQRDFASLEILYSKIDPAHIINNDAKDHDEHEWYIDYFNKK